jgi:C-terminal processing protease CtpA/Prc
MKKLIFLKIFLLFVLALSISLMPSKVKSEEFGGFGIVVAQIFDNDSPNNRGEIVVLHVPKDTEAAKSDIRAGDVIFEIDNNKIAGRQFEDIVLNSLRGQVGSISTLKIKRASEGKILTVSVKRTLIKYTAEPKK